MKVFFICLLVALTSSQTIVPTIDPVILDAIFKGNVPSSTNKAAARVKQLPTTGILDKDGQDCQCVPYYLCDDNNVGVNVTNPDITGYGTLDVRFGEVDERQCEESIEMCCKIPSNPGKTIPQPKPVLNGCGVRNSNGLGVAFTYADTQFGEFPWVVAILDSDANVYHGVGVLIHPEVVMTGAHIARKGNLRTLKIRAGEWDTQTEREIYKFEERSVKEIFSHENFIKKNLQNDIALLRLESPLQLTEHINVICLPEQDEVFDNYKSCIANGWGKDVFGSKGHFAVILKKVEVDMVPYNRCSTLLKRTRLGSHFKLHDSFVCAGGEEGKDACQGDGGAPLVCPIGNKRYKLVGLVAWGIGCGRKDVPGVYTNVPKFREWVNTKMVIWGLV